MEYTLLERSIFRDYDIRGTVPETLNSEAAKSIANAFAVKLRAEKDGKECIVVAVGRDVRLSSPELFEGVVSGLTDCGADVMDIGVCPSPVVYFASKTTEADGYVMITGSHNLPEYNGLKLGSDDNVYHTHIIMNIYNYISDRGYHYADKKGRRFQRDVAGEYIRWMASHFAELKQNIASLPVKPRIVLDAANATASRIAPLLFSELGAEIIPLFCEEDGSFPNHHPDPTVDVNLKDAIKAVAQHNADFAAAYDGDADRIVIVTGSGRIIRGDILLSVFAADICGKYDHPVIIGDVKASKTLYDVLERCGAEGVMWKAGHSMIKLKMIEMNAPLAGETSAHIFFNDRFFGFDDAIYASLRFLEIYVNSVINGEKGGADGLVRDFPEYVNTPEVRVDCPDDKKKGVVDSLKKKIEESEKDLGITGICDIDGLRINFEKGWALCRASNTQPAVVFRFEALDKDHLKRYIHTLQNLTGMQIV
jgi:phosphomannomutase/phosphoglucomutase